MTKRSRMGRSAYGAAVMRAMEEFTPSGQRLFDDQVVIDLLPAPMRFATRSRWVRRHFEELLNHSSPGIRGALLCRTRCIDDMVMVALGRGLRSVVILGAGLDTRAYRLAEMARATVYEVDLAAVQKFKKMRLVRRFGVLPEHVHFVPTDFNTERLDAVLTAAGLRDQERAIFLCEGVTQYLRPDAVDDLLRIIAARPAGTELIFTYVLEEVVTGKLRADRSEAFRKSAGSSTRALALRPRAIPLGGFPSREEPDAVRRSRGYRASRTVRAAGGPRSVCLRDRAGCPSTCRTDWSSAMTPFLSGIAHCATPAVKNEPQHARRWQRIAVAHQGRPAQTIAVHFQLLLYRHHTGTNGSS